MQLAFVISYLNPMLGFLPLCVFVEGLTSHRYIIIFPFKQSKYLRLSHVVWLHLKTSRALEMNHCWLVARCVKAHPLHHH